MKNLKKRIIGGVTIFSMLLSILPMSAFATEDGESPVEAESLVLEESLKQDSTEDKIQSNSSAESGTNSPHILSETEIPYAVNGGNLYFDIATGMITDCDVEVIEAQIPDSIEGVRVISIGNSAFSGCDKLHSIVLPLGLENIYDSAFYKCKSLQSVEIPESVEEVGQYAFAECSNLESVTINGGYIITSAFGNCEKLNKIQLGKRYKSGGSETGRAYFINSFTGSNNITNISGYCGENVIWNLTGTLADGYTITISGTGDTWDFWSYQNSWQVDQPFSYWLQYITKAEVESGIVNLNSGLLRNLKNLKELNISEGVESIGASFCEGCQNLEEVFLPKTIMSVSSSAFKNCSNIRNINLGGLFPLNTSAFDDCVNISTASGYAGDVAWTMDVSRSNVLLNIYGDGAIKDLGSTYINNTWLFNCPSFEDKLVDISIGEGVSHIGARVFEDCTNVKNVSFSDSVTSIGESAFANCSGLTQLVLPNSINSVGNNAFSNCSSLTEVVIQNGVNSIGKSSFSGCTNLNNILIPGSVNIVGEYAFSGCTNLTSVIIENGVTVIGESAFYDCDKLINIDIPDSVTQIGEDVFRNCGSLFKITIPGSISCIEYGAFSNCERLSQVIIQDGTSSISDCAFDGCSSLSSIIIPKSVTRIETFAFDSCNALDNIYYAGSEEEWDKISVSAGNDALESATIHYNSTGPDDPGSDVTDSNIVCMVNTLTSYDENTKRATFGSEPTAYTYQITNETVLSGDINTLIGKTVLVRYKPGEYGAPDMLTHYVLSISPALAASGILKSATQNTICIGDKEYTLDIENGSASLGTLQNYLGSFAVCYFYNNAVVDIKFPQKQTGIFNTGTQSSITIDNKKYPAAFTGPAPYLSAIDLWFEQTVEYWIVDGIIYDIQLPDYETTIYKRLEKIQDNKAYFHDGSNYQIVDSSSIDDSLIGRWVAATLTTSAGGGTILSNMRLFQPQISVKIEMVDDRNIRLKDNKYSYDGSDYVPSSQFEIGYQITIESKVSGVSDSDLAIMQADPTMALTLNDLEITLPDGFNSGWTGSGEISNVSGITILPGQTKVAKGFVRPGMWYFVDEEEVSVTETIQIKLETSVGEYEDEVSFTIMNLNYEPPKIKEEVLNSSETKELIDKAASEMDELDIDSGIMITDLSLAKLDFGIDDNSLTRLKKELLTEIIMSSAPEDSLSDQIADDLMSKVFGEYKSPVSGSKYTVPLRYVFETPDYGMLTVQFTCNINSFTLNSSKYALYATVDYEVLQQDKDSGDKSWPSYKKGDFAQIAFADVKAYTDAAYDVAKEAIKDAYDDVWGKQANQIADFLFDDVVKAILKATKTSFSDVMWKIMTWPTENMSVACPVDIFIYDANGNLCGSIESNQVTKTSTEFGLSVSGNVKYVTGLRDNYKVIYKATGNGSMDIAITEYTGYESPLRAITFKAVPLAQDETYTQNIAGEVLAEVNGYKLIADAEEKDIMPDDKVVLIGLASEENQQEETPTPTPEPDSNSGGSSSASNSANRYTISVVDEIDNGSISVSPSQAKRGDIVTITVDPDEGYKLDTLTVTNRNGNRIATEKKSKTVYTFEMPSGRVSINATFIKIEEETTQQTSGEPFADVSSRDWFYDAVQYVFENGLMGGTSETTFGPNQTTTRGMIVTILYRLENEPAVTGTTAFTDVAADQYYANAVTWAAQNGIVSGTTVTTFAPNNAITREQMAAILYRYAQFKGYDVLAKADLSTYTDAVNINAYATDAMTWANCEQLITGTSATTLTPAGNATRAQVATILMRFCENIAK